MAPPLMSNWEADEPGVTPAWWTARRKYFPDHCWPAFDSFLARLTFYTVHMTQDNMETVIVEIQTLRSEVFRGKELRIAPSIRRGLARFGWLNSPHDVVLVGSTSAEGVARLTRALDRLTVVLGPARNPVPLAYRI